jgi:hypothetical protein
MFDQYKQVNNAFIGAGEKAFSARIPIYNNPYSKAPFRSLWIRGWKRAEKAFNEMVRKSKAFQETLPLEEVND